LEFAFDEMFDGRLRDGAMIRQHRRHAEVA
jgi:hypothetical protein